LPSIGTGTSRSNGFDVVSMNRMKPIETRPMMPSTRATNASGSLRLHCATASIQALSMASHSSSEPSWPPQTPAMRYGSGSVLLELLAT
jgi:hypothetical protein